MWGVCVGVGVRVCVRACGTCCPPPKGSGGDAGLLFKHNTACFPPSALDVAGARSQDHYLSRGEGVLSK